MSMPNFKIVVVYPKNYKDPRWVKKFGVKATFKHKHTRYKSYHYIDLPFTGRRYR